MAAGRQLKISILFEALGAKKISEDATGIVKAVNAIGAPLRAVDSFFQKIAGSGTTVKNALTQLKNQFPGITAAANLAVKGIQRIGSVGKSIVNTVLSLKTAIVGFAAVFVAGRIASSLGSTVNELDRLIKVARRTGQTVEDLSRLRVAADLAGLDFETLAKAIKFLNISVADLTDERIKAFRQLGISKDQLKSLTSAADLLPAIADGLQDLSEPERISALQKIFGRAGFEVATFLEGGADKFRESLRLVDEFGLVITEHQAAQAEKLQDAVTLVSFAWEKVKASIIDAIGPNTSDLFQELARRLAKLPSIAGATARTFRNSLFGNDNQQREAKEALITLRDSFLSALITTAKEIGKLIGLSLIEAIKTGITLVGPQLADLIQDALGATIIGIDKSLQTRVRDAQAKQTQLLGDLKRLQEEQARLTKPTGRQPGALTIGSGVGLLGAPTITDEEARRKGQILDDIKAKQEEIATVQKTINDLSAKAIEQDRQRKLSTDNALRDLLTNVPDLANKAGAAIKSAFKTLDDATDKVLELGKEAPVQVNKTLQAVNEFIKVIESAPRQLDRLKLTAEDVFDRIAKGIKKAFAGTASPQERFFIQRELEIQAALASGDEVRAARLKLENDQLKRRNELFQQFGASATIVAEVLDKLETSERLRLQEETELEPLLKKLQQSQQSYNLTLQETQTLIESGRITQSEGRQRVTDSLTQLIESTVAARDKVAQLLKGDPNNTQLRDQLQELNLEIDKLRSQDTSHLGAFDGIKAGLNEIAGRTKDVFQTFKDLTIDVAETFTNNFTEAFGAVIDGTKSIKDAFRDFVSDTLIEIAKLIVKILILKAISIAAGIPVGVANALPVNKGGSIRRFRRLNRGGFNGWLPDDGSPDRDSVPAVLTPGEFVLRRKAARYYGLAMLDAMNKMLIPREVIPRYAARYRPTPRSGYATGGEVSAIPSISTSQTAVIMGEREWERALAGSGDALLRFMERRRGEISAIVNGRR